MTYDMKEKRWEKVITKFWQDVGIFFASFRNDKEIKCPEKQSYDRERHKYQIPFSVPCR